MNHTTATPVEQLIACMKLEHALQKGADIRKCIDELRDKQYYDHVIQWGTHYAICCYMGVNRNRNNFENVAYNTHVLATYGGATFTKEHAVRVLHLMQLGDVNGYRVAQTMLLTTPVYERQHHQVWIAIDDAASKKIHETTNRIRHVYDSVRQRWAVGVIEDWWFQIVTSPYTSVGINMINKIACRWENEFI